MRDFIDYLQEAFITASGGNTYDTSVRSLVPSSTRTRIVTIVPMPHSH